MVGLVLVSHSKKLAEAVRDMVLQMTAPDYPVAVAAGAGDNHEHLGTDAVHISEVLQQFNHLDGVLVLMDLGSAVLSAETALELLALPPELNILLCAAPLVEGAIAGAVQAYAGGSLEEVAREAERGLAAKEQQLKSEDKNMAMQDASSVPTVDCESSELLLTVKSEHGLHARPAAALVRTVSKYDAAVQITNMRSGKGPVSARSLTSIALLEINQGDQIRVMASGAERELALEAIRKLAESSFGDSAPAPALPITAPALAATSIVQPGTSPVGGIPGSQGIAIGPVCVLEPSLVLPEDHSSADPAVEIQRLDAAMKSVALELSRQKISSSSAAFKEQSVEILEAQALILTDPLLQERLTARLQTEHTSAARTWMEETEKLSAEYQSMTDLYLRERCADIRDIARRVLQKLGAVEQARISFDRPCVLFTNELLPGEAAECDPAMVLGVITREGSPTSHSTIILRSVGIPAVLGATGIDEHAAGKTIALDGATGEIWIEPDPQTISRLKIKRAEFLERERQAKAERLQPSITLDGKRVEILANVGNAADARIAAENGAEGIGLLRTELLFMERKSGPAEQEQISSLHQVFSQITGPIVVRTLDIGADKPLPFLPQKEEHNPYLGVRGLRLCLQNPEFFLTHLRAILRSGVGHDVWLMFPMVSTLGEVNETLELLDRAHGELAREGLLHLWPIKRGAMIEVPAAALMSRWLAEKLDFFSIGTNDLTQYVMAAERGNTSVAALQDSLHPAVLQVIKAVIEGAKTRERHVSLCGDAASDPLSALIFAGLGVHSLSIRPKQVPEIKSLFRKLKMADLRQLADRSLRCSDAEQVRAITKEFWDAARCEVELLPAAIHAQKK